MKQDTRIPPLAPLHYAIGLIFGTPPTTLVLFRLFFSRCLLHLNAIRKEKNGHRESASYRVHPFTPFLRALRKTRKGMPVGWFLSTAVTALFMVEPLLSGIVLGLVPATIIGLFVV